MTVDLAYRERGKGPVVILLHGFPFNQTLWDDYAEKLSAMFRVFTLDLPGFGNSKPLKEPFSIDDISRKVISWIQEKGLRNVVLVGHSMGGYVSLAIAEKAPEILAALVLFHSTAYPDSKEKKESRNKAMAFIAKNGATAFTSSFITPLFANPQHPDIEKVRSIAMQSTAETLTGYIRAMRNRPDRQEVLKNFPKKILFLAGEKDAGIPIDTIHRQAGLCTDASVAVLPDTGHMSMFENREQSLQILKDFVNSLQLPV